jgi:hypothetical protein
MGSTGDGSRRSRVATVEGGPKVVDIAGEDAGKFAGFSR